VKIRELPRAGLKIAKIPEFKKNQKRCKYARLTVQILKKNTINKMPY